MSAVFANKWHPEVKTYAHGKTTPVISEVTVAGLRQAHAEGCKADATQCKTAYDGEIIDSIVQSPQLEVSAYSMISKIITPKWRSRCIIVNVEYRLAPEHKYPASLDDAVCVVRAVMNNKSEFGGSDGSKVGVAGDSSGGFLVVAVCHEVAGLDFQIPIYPRVNYSKTIRRQSDIEYADDPFLSSALTAWFGDNYIRTEEDREDIRLNPYFREGFDKLPPAMFVVAECDVLRDESYDYSKKLQDAGVRSELVLIEGACHGFFVRPEHFKECCAKAYSRVVEFILSFT